MKIFLFIVTVATLLYSVATQQECIDEDQRVDCYPEADASEAACLARGCLWCEAAIGVPWCHVPLDWGYKIDGEIQEIATGYRVNLIRNAAIGTYFGRDIESLTADFDFQSDYRLRIKIVDTSASRFEVPLKINPTESGPTNKAYNIEFSDSPVFSFKVIRNATATVLLDTSLGGFTFSDQYIQLGIRIPSRNAYGFGENEQYSFRHDFSEYRSFPMYARDQSPDYLVNLYGVHPYYTVVEDDGNTHSVVIVNSNAQEVILTPAPGYVYRTIGGILDMYVFLGPTPENTVQQFTEAIGRQPIPPYWGLGFQLCKWGYDNIENMKAAVDRTAQYNIPHDVQYGDIDIMERELIFTVDTVNFAGLPEYVRELKTRGIKFVTILDPFVSYSEPAGTYPPHSLGNSMDVWMKRKDGTPVIGSSWPGLVYYPDFSRNSTKTWWKNLIRDFKDLLDWDGLWIDMNEPANWGKGDIGIGCDQNNINYPPYVPAIRNGELFDLTLCPDFQQDFGIHYDTHSLYGWSHSLPTFEAVRETLGKRGMVLSRSTFLGSGNWAAHWLGDNFSRWSNLYHSIIGMLQFNHFGIPYVGADICGFNENAEKEMCQRWQELGAFYPYSRNHNGRDNLDQDPGVWGPEVGESSRKALEVRYTLLPYLYTLFYLHKTQGNTVVRALWHEYVNDQVALGIDRQFLWGTGILITPVLDPEQTQVQGYFPDARWYDYYTGAELSTRKDFVTLDAPLDVINVHVHGGNIIPTQDPAVNTEASRRNPRGLIISLDDNQEATGKSYYDDGDSIDPQDTGLYFLAEYTYSNGTLRSYIVRHGYAGINTQILRSIRLLGAGPITSVLLNGQTSAPFTTLPSGEVRVNNLNILINTRFFITFA